MSTNYKHPSDVPTEELCARLDELSVAVANKAKRGDELTMRIPAECDRDADIVLAEAAKRLREREQNVGEAVAETPLKDAELLRTLCEDVPDMHPTVLAQLRRLASNIDSGAMIGKTRCKKCGGSEEMTIHTYTRPAQAVSVPDGWRVSFCTSSARRPDDGWEVYDPSGTGGVIGFSQIQSGIVSRLMDQLASAPTAEAT